MRIQKCKRSLEWVRKVSGRRMSKTPKVRTKELRSKKLKQFKLGWS